MSFYPKYFSNHFNCCCETQVNQATDPQSQQRLLLTLDSPPALLSSYSRPGMEKILNFHILFSEFVTIISIISIKLRLFYVVYPPGLGVAEAASSSWLSLSCCFLIWDEKTNKKETFFFKLTVLIMIFFTLDLLLFHCLRSPLWSRWNLKEMQTHTRHINKQLWTLLTWLQLDTYTCRYQAAQFEVIASNLLSLGVVEGATSLLSSLLCCSLICMKKVLKNQHRYK